MPTDRLHERVVERMGRRWRIREVEAGNVPGSHGARCLICECDDVVRRIWSYPSNWWELPDDRLLAICDRSAA